MRTAIVLFLLVSSLALAKGVHQRVQFARGASSATMKGAVIRGDRDTYVLGAGAGQVMTVQVTSPEDNAVFQIYAPGGKALRGADAGDDAMSWEGPLPRSGDFRIVVGPSRGNATYVLSVKIR